MKRILIIVVMFLLALGWLLLPGCRTYEPNPKPAMFLQVPHKEPVFLPIDPTPTKQN